MFSDQTCLWQAPRGCVAPTTSVPFPSLLYLATILDPKRVVREVHWAELVAHEKLLS